MPPNTVYTPRRRMLMQGVLWLVLLLTLGAAAWLSHWKSGRWNVTLAAPEDFGAIRLALPKNWENESHRSTATGELLQLRETIEPRRFLVVRSFRLREYRSSLDVLAESIRLPMEFVEQNPEILRDLEELKVKNGDGVVLHLARSRSSPLMRLTSKYDSIACIMLHDGRGAIIQLGNPQPATPADDALIMKVAQSIELRDQAPAPVGDENSI